jgi:hypothetical protein
VLVVVPAPVVEPPVAALVEELRVALDTELDDADEEVVPRLVPVAVPGTHSPSAQTIPSAQ